MSFSLSGGDSRVSLYDAGGNMIYQAGSIDAYIDIPESDGDARVSYADIAGERYAVREKTSDVNGWRYVSTVRLPGVMSGLSLAQIVVIAALVVLMVAAVFIILMGIINKYQPISNLAATLSDAAPQGKPDGMIDEKQLLSNTIATLKSDSEQKRKLEAAYQEASLASKAKSTFLSSMSHDIRTPMNAIIGRRNARHLPKSAGQIQRDGEIA